MPKVRKLKRCDTSELVDELIARGWQIETLDESSDFGPDPIPRVVLVPRRREDLQAVK